MPTVSIVRGIAVMMFYNDHGSPHVHLAAADFKAKFDLGELYAYDVTGRLTHRQLRDIRSWAAQHRAALFENWARARRNEPPHRIED